MEKEKFTRFVKTSLMDLVVAGVAISYVAFSLIVVKGTDLNPLELIAKSVLAIIAAILIKEGLGENGITRGYLSDEWKSEMEKYNLACNSANQYMERTDNFYNCEEIEKRKKYRQQLLMSVRLKYSMFFDELGDYKEDILINTSKKKKEGYINLTKKQHRILKKAIKVKIYNLNLFSEYENNITSSTHREKTDKDQRIKMFGKNTIMTILSAIAGVYFTVTWNDFNIASLILSIVQVLIWIATGIIQLYANYNYIVIEKVNKLKQKKEGIQKFKSGCEAGLYTTNPYDEIEKRRELKYE